MKYNLLILLLLVSCVTNLWTNNLQIGSPVFTEKNTTSGQVKLQFDISWDNSWRTDNLNGDGVTNWDAVWLFVKYQKASDSLWYHAALNTSAANHSTGSQAGGAIISPRADGIGAYYYRSANGTGTFSSTSVKLCWNYAADEVGNNLSQEIIGLKVFGIEMVYIPQGAFYVGSGGDETGHFYTYGTNNLPYLINSENAITVGTTNGNIYYSDVQISSGDRFGPIPASFPKGYNAFYCMKYEITQEQYVHFLNTLTRAQQNTRTGTNLASGVTSVSNRYVMSNTISISYRNGIRCDATIPAASPITFYCDFNGNGVPNEANDGQNVACNYLNWVNGCAYSDWSGLRPMTELEFEKICRGVETPVPNEYAWGNVSGMAVTGIEYQGTATEETIPSNANCASYGASLGPVRVGNFSRAVSTRQSSGASYYGIMELTGNLMEQCITVGNSAGRANTGNHGNGVLTFAGNSDIVNCPGTNSSGSGMRGGAWWYYYWQYFLPISCRYIAAGGDSYDQFCLGFRCVGGE